MSAEAIDVNKYLSEHNIAAPLCGNGAVCALKLPRMACDAVPAWTCWYCLENSRPGRKNKELEAIRDDAIAAVGFDLIA